MTGRLLQCLGEKLEKEIALVEVDETFQFDLEVRTAIAVNVACNDRAVVSGAGPVLEENLQRTGCTVELGGLANKVEGLIAWLFAVGVDAAQIDLVGATLEVGNAVAVAKADAGFAGRIELKAIPTSATRQYIPAEPADEEVVASATVEFVVASVASQQIVARVAP